MSKIELNDVVSFTGVNARLKQIEDEFNNKVLYRDNPVGEPNTLATSVDANDKDLFNINDVRVDNNIYLRGVLIEDAINAESTANVEASAAFAAASQVSANSSASSAASAASSASSAADSYDSFDDRYLGAKSVPPTVDNDGNPLLIGALYWDTTLSPGGTFPASNITFAPSGNISATLVQSAIEELDSEKAKLNGDAAVAFASSAFTGPLTGASTGAHNGSVGATTPNTGSFTTIVASGTITPSQTNGIVGTTTNNNANAGSVGEYLTATGAGTAMTTNVPVSIASISLTAGDWDVSSVAQIALGAGATMTAIAVGTTNTNNVLSTFDRNLSNTGFSANNSFGSLTYPSPVTRFSLSATTTIYCVSVASFTGGTCTGTGFIRARRIR